MEIKQKERNEIPQKYKWNLNLLYKTDEDWSNSHTKILSDIGIYESKYKNNLTSSYKILLEALNKRDNIYKELKKLYVYATMNLHEDMSSQTYQALSLTAQQLVAKGAKAFAFIESELLEADKTLIKGFCKQCEDLKLYEHYFNELYRGAKHILSKNEEAILAASLELANSSDNIYRMLNNTDMDFGYVIDSDGSKVELSHGKFISLLESTNREVRHNSFKKYYEAYWSKKNTYTAILYSSVKKDIFYSRTRGYKSSLERALFGDNIPVSTYYNLIETVSAYLPELHKYMDIRKKRLKLKDLHMYDLHTPIIFDVQTKIDYDTSCTIVLSSLKPMGLEYVSKVRDAIDNNLIDVYENKGKISGAYSWGAYGNKPYILLNYNNTINDMFTLAHELGHSMHSRYTFENQPHIYGDYSIFLAEIASTVNENLLMSNLISQDLDKKQKDYMINYNLEQFRNTVFRQTMFAEFELTLHEQVEQDKPVTEAYLNELYIDLNKKYYGNMVHVDETIAIEWARIPHFYKNFYVYQYATGFSAAVAIAHKILNEKDYPNLYIKKFLSVGSSKYPMEILNSIGIDMTTKSPLELALDKFKTLVEIFKGETIL